MNKATLITKLNDIKGNPQVAVWNGFVGDYQDIGDLVEVVLYEITEEYYIESIRMERAIDKKDWTFAFTEDEVLELKNSYKQHTKWELNEYITEDDIKQKRYKSKRVFLIEPKSRGISTFDRTGNIEY